MSYFLLSEKVDIIYLIGRYVNTPKPYQLQPPTNFPPIRPSKRTEKLDEIMNLLPSKSER
jgi:hypothetical protein